jgi:superfamily II DNA or RNA helicase
MLNDEQKRKYRFEFCYCCPTANKCELLNEYLTISKNNPGLTYPSYNQRSQAQGCIYNRDNVVACGNKRVSDGIGGDYKIDLCYNYTIESDTNKWEPKQAIFISAQTGQGKNYFVEDVLLKYVKELNYKHNCDHKILILSNRLALQAQIKDRLGYSDYSDEDLHNTIIKYRDCVDIMTYQSVLNMSKYLKNKQKTNRSRYTFIICDEAHFFTSDAMFNCDTERILSTIVNVFQDSIRVYMSATPYQCFDYIREAEKDPIALYHFTRNYDYLDIKYYSEFEELMKYIVTSVNRNSEKWMIFIDDIDKCESMNVQLVKYGIEMNSPMDGKVFAVSAKSKAILTYREILKKESFVNNIKVLITTSVLDNGVNFRDIDHIVVSDIDKVKCLQMLGRARVNYDANMNPLDRKTLYIKTANIEYMRRRVHDLERRVDAYHDFDLAFVPTGRFEDGNNYMIYFIKKYYHGSEQDWNLAKRCFRIDDKDAKVYHRNEIAKQLSKDMLAEYKLILEEMEEEDNCADIGQKVSGRKYLEYQLSWFNKTYNPEDDITCNLIDKAKIILQDFLA